LPIGLISTSCCTSVVSITVDQSLAASSHFTPIGILAVNGETPNDYRVP